MAYSHFYYLKICKNKLIFKDKLLIIKINMSENFDMAPRKEFSISKHIIDDYFFERLQRFCDDCEDKEDIIDDETIKDKCFCGISYKRFMKWNVEVFSKLSPERKSWIETLCNECESSKISIMDEESCVSFTAQKIFFDNSGRLVITNPR